MDLWCGLCRSTIERGQPYQQVRSDGMRRVRVRCADCAEGPVPPDLPMQDAPAQQLTRKMQRLKDAIANTDWKKRAEAEGSR